MHEIMFIVDAEPKAHIHNTSRKLFHLPGFLNKVITCYVIGSLGNTLVHLFNR